MSEISNIVQQQGLESITERDIRKILASLPADLPVTLRRADGQLDAPPPVPEDRETLTQWHVLRLGRQRQSGDGGAASPEAELVRLLCARRETFSIGLHGERDGSAALLVGTKDAEGTETLGLLRAAYRVAEAAPAVVSDYQRSSWARCVRLEQEDGGEAPEKAESRPAPPDWADRLIQAAAGMGYDARMIFSPLPAGWLDRAVAETAELADELSMFRDSGVQLSGNTSISPSEIGNIAGKAIVLLRGEQKENVGRNVSLSEEYKREHSLVGLRQEELKSRLRQLRLLQRDGGWSVSLRLSARRPEELRLLQSVLGGALLAAGFRCDWADYEPTAGAALPSARLPGLVSLPRRDFYGLTFDDIHEYEANPPRAQAAGVPLGNLIWNGRQMQADLRLPLDQLNRHVFVCGKTGAGKSNTMCGLLTALRGVPFLVIEPVKGEYWSLDKSVPGGVSVYNMDAGDSGRLAFNPFWFPKGGNLSFHIAGLKSTIAAAFDLYAAMPNILEQCLTSAYLKTGWKIAASRNIYEGRLPDELLYPTFSTLCSEIELYLQRSDFSGEAQGNYKGALLSRLQTFTTGTKGMLLNGGARPPFMEWIENGTSCVLELEALADDADKAIVMGTLLSQYFQCVKLRGTGRADGLRHVIVLEEAHHLFREGQAGTDGSSSRQQLVETLNNLLAEIRAYGEGVFIVDQSPTGISPQVIKNTAVKIVHNIDYGDDLEVLQRALLLPRDDINAPASLERGCALVRYGAMKQPMLVAMPPCKVKEENGLHRRDGAVRTDSGFLEAQTQINERYHAELAAACGKFLNHYLLDDLLGSLCALDELIAQTRAMLYRLGYDETTIASEFGTENLRYILKTVLDGCLSARYPDQYLLRTRIRMAAERFISLRAGRGHGVRPEEWRLLRNFREREIYPMLDQLNRNSEDRMTHFFSFQGHAYMAGILREFAEEWNRQAQLVGREKLLSYSTEQQQRLLLTKCFFVRPNEALVAWLWDAFRYFLDRERSKSDAPAEDAQPRDGETVGGGPTLYVKADGSDTSGQES